MMVKMKRLRLLFLIFTALLVCGSTDGCWLSEALLDDAIALCSWVWRCIFCRATGLVGRPETMAVYAKLAAISTPTVQLLQQSLLTSFAYVAPFSSWSSVSLTSSLSSLTPFWQQEQVEQARKRVFPFWPKRMKLFLGGGISPVGGTVQQQHHFSGLEGNLIASHLPDNEMSRGANEELHIMFDSGTDTTETSEFSEKKQEGASQLETAPVSISSTKFIADCEPPLWSNPGRLNPLELRKQIFCNRSLNMKSIVAVGFDMDYTLAQYKASTFEGIAYTGTVRKLVYDLGYPTELLEWQFDWTYMVRGLVLDKKRGCILKMDRHKYVKVAYHGFRELSREERHATYCNTLSRDSYDEPDYALIDTLFSLAEAYLFMQLVDFRDAFPDKIRYDYAQIYKHVREAVDLCHRDGTLKQAVAHNPGMYIHQDPHIFPMLKMLKQSGRMTFLVTNSLWDYTHVVMNFLNGKCGTEGGIPRDDEWLSYFDVVITGSAKPAFFMDGNRAPLFEVDTKSGMLLNTDHGNPLAQIGGVDTATQVLLTKTTGQTNQVFQGGSVAHLHRLLAIESGSQVLYAGDHIYGDILRSKKQLGWRTMLVVPELEMELNLLSHTSAIRKEFQRLRQQGAALEGALQRLEWTFQFDDCTKDERERLSNDINSLQTERNNVRELHRQFQREFHHRFHKIWGQLMKTGYQNSRFSHQVERFACLYTSHVTNLCYYSPDKSYRTSEDYMPHELEGMGF